MTGLTLVGLALLAPFACAVGAWVVLVLVAFRGRGQ